MIADAGFSLEKTAHVRNAQMSFLWWVRPEQNPPELVQEIRDAFAQLSRDEAREHYTVRPEGDDFYFSWPMYAVKRGVCDENHAFEVLSSQTIDFRRSVSSAPSTNARFLGNR